VANSPAIRCAYRNCLVAGGERYPGRPPSRLGKVAPAGQSPLADLLEWLAPRLAGPRDHAEIEPLTSPPNDNRAVASHSRSAQPLGFAGPYLVRLCSNMLLLIQIFGSLKRRALPRTVRLLWEFFLANRFFFGWPKVATFFFAANRAGAVCLRPNKPRFTELQQLPVVNSETIHSRPLPGTRPLGFRPRHFAQIPSPLPNNFPLNPKAF